MSRTFMNGTIILLLGVAHDIPCSWINILRIKNIWRRQQNRFKNAGHIDMRWEFSDYLWNKYLKLGNNNPIPINIVFTRSKQVVRIPEVWSQSLHNPSPKYYRWLQQWRILDRPWIMELLLSTLTLSLTAFTSIPGFVFSAKLSHSSTHE